MARSFMRRAICFVPISLLMGCADQPPDNDLVQRLFQIMDANMEGWEDVTSDVCPLVDAAALNEIVGIRIGDDEIERVHVFRNYADKEGFLVWIIPRSKVFHWSQYIAVTIEDGRCSAQNRVFRFPGL